MSSQLLIGNIPVDSTEASLTQLCEPFGKVKSVSLPQTSTGKSKGFAFVAMSSRKEAITAQAGLLNLQLGGRQLTVSLKEESKPEPPGLYGFLRLFRA